MLRSEDVGAPPGVTETRREDRGPARKRKPRVTWARLAPVPGVQPSRPEARGRIAASPAIERRRRQAPAPMPVLDVKVLQAVKVASTLYRADWMEVLANPRGRLSSRAGAVELKVVRALAAYLANACGNVEVAIIARMMGSSIRTTQSRIDGIEDRRDDQRFDHFVTTAEALYDQI